jgi:hypothetical protein
MEMAMPESKQARRHFFRSPWLVFWTLGLGLAVFIATVIGGHVGNAFVSLGVFVAFAAFLYVGFGAGNETISGLAAPRRDERWAMINQKALAFAGTVLVLILVGGWLVELANGDDGSPYSLIMGGGVVAYFAAALWLRARS